jgi:hypothetical protein
MCEARSLGKRVILAGDLNISRRPEDIFWGYRMVHVPTFLAVKGLIGEQREMQLALSRYWDGIKKMLASGRPRTVSVRTTHQVDLILITSNSATKLKPRQSYLSISE